MTRTQARRLRPGDQIAIHEHTLTIRRVTRRWPWSRDITLHGSLHAGTDTDTLYRVRANQEMETR